ncbi:MAG: DUF1778 domain-containing protein [Verrucomicrobia bacterium]|nr:DUF1778 domain-containing protein [Verrucomicrobiota bacterium]
MYGDAPYTNLGYEDKAQEDIMGQPARKERFEMRISPAHKELITAAAALRGLSLTDFATGVLVQQSAEVVEQFGKTQLSARDRDRFLEMIDEDTPNQALREAAESFLAHG